VSGKRCHNIATEVTGEIRAYFQSGPNTDVHPCATILDLIYDVL